MAPRLPAAPRRPSTHSLASTPRSFHTTPTRRADYIPRPRRPYQFTQLLTLSDGSAFLHRTTSPAPVYRSVRDTRNNPLWNPRDMRMAGVEEDEAGRLREFRRRFGRSFERTQPGAPAAGGVGLPREEGGVSGDPSVGPGQAATEEKALGAGPGEAMEEDAAESGKQAKDAARKKAAPSKVELQEDEDEAVDNLMDLIGSYGRGRGQEGVASGRVASRDRGSSGKKR